MKPYFGKAGKYAVHCIAGLFLAGVMLVMGGWIWNDMQTDQTKYYNRGRIAYIGGAYDYALKNFDLSYGDYNARVNAQTGPTAAPPSLEQAELAQEHKALALVKMKQTKEAVIAYKECLLLTSDWYLSNHQVLPGESDAVKVAAAVTKVKEDGRDCAINLEILFHQQQQQAEQEGKGQGADGKGKPKEGDKQSEDPQSANGAGKQSRDGVDD